ncbi:uncharacterized protein LOC135613481 [Musa acuminata AAA Group]|uniref:uncharacterized protein LOC135613481 n=1 Tax=Musa acuminata AAA Group TaxID=214697 RepID=UPI0031DC2E04
MEAVREFEDWVVLSSSAAAASDGFVVIHGTADDVRSENFDSDARTPTPSSSEEQEEEESGDGGLDSDYLRWGFPDSDSERAADGREELVVSYREDSNAEYETKMIDWSHGEAMAGYDHEGSNSDDETKTIDLRHGGDLMTQRAAERGDETVVSDLEDSNERQMIDSSDGGDSMTQSSSSDDLILKESCSNGIDGIRGANEMEHEEDLELTSDEIEELKEEYGETDASGISGCCGEERRGVMWWSMPFRNLKLNLFKVKPIWSVSVLAAFVGFAVLGRMLNSIKQENPSVSHRALTGDKMAPQLTVDAASPTRRNVSVIKAFLEGGDVSRKPVLSLR